MNDVFDRFSDQCERCSCYIENCDPNEVINPDADCTLEQKTYGNKSCDFYDNCKGE